MTKVELKPAAVITVVFEGQEYSMVRPKLGVQQEMEEKMDSLKKSGKGGSKHIAEWFQKLGLPKSVVDQLDTEQVEALMEVLIPSKKK